MPIKVLVVEPDVSLRAGFVELLKLSGFDIVQASTFHEARTALRDQSPGLLITEVRLAGFNGLQLIITNPTPIPSIVIAHADPVLEAEAGRFGAVYLNKPVSQADLLVAIERQLVSGSESTTSGLKRQWSRKQVNTDLRARIADSPARVLDISYGGLRAEVDRTAEEPLPRTFSLKLTEADFDIPADLVWSSRIGDSWQCGIALAHMGQMEATTWRSLVDRVQ